MPESSLVLWETAGMVIRPEPLEISRCICISGSISNDADGNEVSVNPYWVLCALDDKKLVYDY